MQLKNTQWLIIANKKCMMNFDNIIEEMAMHGIPVPDTGVQISISNAKELMHEMLSKIIAREHRQMQWIQPYDQVAEWLSDNKGMGLFMYGNCGLGKSLIARYVIPGLLLRYHRKVVNVYDTNVMNAKIDEVLSKKIVCIDDVGTEDLSVRFGEKRLAFAEVMDVAEKKRNLIIATSNLTIDEILERYGERVLDRIKSTTKRVVFIGKSFR